MRPIRVVRGDDHTLVRQGLVALLVSSSIRVEGTSGDGRELVRKVLEIRPDSAMVDLSMPLLNGLEATQQIARIAPETRVLILSMFNDREQIAQAHCRGALGYLSKDDAPERLIEAIETISAGGRYFPPEIDGRANGLSAKQLTAREREILQLIAEGKKNSEIAEVMMHSIHTVRNHRARLMKKLGAHNAIELIQAAEEIGLLYLAPPKGER